MKRILFVLFAVVVLAGAKATAGNDFNADNLTQLQINQTTLPQAVALLGAEPESSAVGRSGATSYTWYHVAAKSSLWTGKSSATGKRAMLVFNTDGTFQRILQLDGVVLPPEEHRRLMTDPAVEARTLMQGSDQK